MAQQNSVVAITAGSAAAPPPPGLEDVWPRLCEIMAHLAALRLDEAAVQSQQRDMVRHGCMLSPPLAPGADSDVCTRSWFHEHQFYYALTSAAGEPYFLVTGLLDRGYSLDTLWLPRRRVAVSNYPSEIDGARLDRLAAALSADAAKPPADDPPANAPRAAVSGFTHMMHVLWNELPALEKLAATTLPPAFELAMLFEPFGPTEAIFPELAGRVRPLAYADVPAANRSHALLVGLGSWNIPAALQHRIRRVAATLADPVVLVERDRFVAAHPHRFWISVKPPNRTLDRQAEVLAGLVQDLAARFPGAGFIIDGASTPADYPANANYQPWMHDIIDRAAAGSAAVMAEMAALIPEVLQASIVWLNDVANNAEIVWGEAATFYVCHGGTMQNKIGWLHATPGFVHSNRAFIEAFRAMPAPVPPGTRCFYPTDGLIVDDEAANYTPLELARKDQNYSFTSRERLADEVAAAVVAASA